VWQVVVDGAGLLGRSRDGSHDETIAETKTEADAET